ncbi:MAG: hypothetical protein ABR579_05675 [Actinomycetota bacterium]
MAPVSSGDGKDLDDEVPEEEREVVDDSTDEMKEDVRRPHIPIDAPEADALDQSLPANLDDDEDLR